MSTKYEICRHCKYWFTKHSYKGIRGECRAQSPTVNGWPETGEYDWCGQWDRAKDKELKDREEIKKFSDN